MLSLKLVRIKKTLQVITSLCQNFSHIIFELGDSYARTFTHIRFHTDVEFLVSQGHTHFAFVKAGEHTHDQVNIHMLPRMVI